MKSYAWGTTQGGVYRSVITTGKTKEQAMKRAQKELKTKQVQFIQEVK